MLEMLFQGGASNKQIVDVMIAENETAYETFVLHSSSQKAYVEIQRAQRAWSWLLCYWNLMIRTDKIDVRKDGRPLECSCEIVQVRWRILSGTVTLFSVRRSPQWCQSSGVRFGTMCRGDAQLLEDECMDSSM